MTSRRTGFWAIVMIATIAAASPAMCWGPEGHELITRHAVEMLPSDIRAFYDENERYIVTLSTLPDDWRVTHRGTGPQHYFDLDLLDKPPFAKVRGSRADVEKRFGKEKVLEMGLLPWTIEERFGKLVAAMKAGDGVEIVVQSALLSHFVGDAHVPFHATRHYDGNKPEQKGLHFRWETSLVALKLKPESIKPAVPARVGDIYKAAFDWCVDSWSYVDAICAAEDTAREKDPNHGYRYHETLANETLGILQNRISASASSLAGVYIAAWERAGKPKLPDKPALLFWGS